MAEVTSVQQAYAIIAKTKNVEDLVLYDEVDLGSALQYTAFPRNPSSAGNKTNYQGNPFPYNWFLIKSLSGTLDLSLITDAIRLVLLNCAVILQKNKTEVWRGPLWNILGPTGYAAVLDTTVKPYYNYTGLVELEKPISMGPNDQLNFQLYFDSTTGISTAQLQLQLHGVGAVGIDGITPDLYQ